MVQHCHDYGYPGRIGGTVDYSSCSAQGKTTAAVQTEKKIYIIGLSLLDVVAVSRDFNDVNVQFN